ncbi:MAG: class I SAM-dependent methyltransferase [Candidatus Methylomirabilales bacterium]
MTETVQTCECCGGRAFTPVLSQRDLLFDRPTPMFRIVRCDDCALLFTNPRPSREEMAGYYPEDYYCSSKVDCLLHQYHDASADSWRRRLKARLRERFYGYPPASTGNPGLLEHMLRGPLLFPLSLYLRFWRDRSLIPFIGEGRILDVGCGLGFTLARYRQWGWIPSGVEFSPIAAQHAREVLGLPVFQGELLDAKFPAESFDVLLFQHSLEHLLSPSLELREAYRILRGSGLLVVMVPNAGGLDARLFGRWWVNWDLPRHLYHFTPRTASALLAKAGFRVQRIVLDRDPTNFVVSVRYLAEHKFGVSRISDRALRPVFHPVSGPLALLGMAGHMTLFCVKA